MHELAGLPLLGHALSTATALGAEHVAAVVRHEREQIVEYIKAFYPTALIADQDDVPDGAPVVHLEGFGLEDTHSVINSLRWGPDGWLYGCHGVFTHSRVGKPGTPTGITTEGPALKGAINLVLGAVDHRETAMS